MIGLEKFLACGSIEEKIFDLDRRSQTAACFADVMCDATNDDHVRAKFVTFFSRAHTEAGNGGYRW